MSDQYDWLVEEMASIKTNKFYIVDGPASPQLQEAVENSPLLVPPSYKEFVLRFGNAKLYRRSGYWLVRVYAGPREAATDKAEPLIHFGRTDRSLAYFKESLLVEGSESPVFEWRYQQGVRKTADGFAQWLKAKCAWARRQFKKKEWERIEEGPAPFTERELAIVEARKRFRWRVVGITPNGNLRFEIHNTSNLVLPYFSLGIRGSLRPPKSGPMGDGAVALPVASIRPGAAKIVEFDCYKELVAPEEVEVFDLPDPGPEDRDLYWEFNALA